MSGPVGSAARRGAVSMIIGARCRCRPADAAIPRAPSPHSGCQGAIASRRVAADHSAAPALSLGISLARRPLCRDLPAADAHALAATPLCPYTTARIMEGVPMRLSRYFLPVLKEVPAEA